jgi:flagellar hook-length control protein FliK
VTQAAEVPPRPQPQTMPSPENVGRLIDSMKFQVKQGVQEATVRLNPEHLGEVTISVRVERGAVSAVIHTDTPAVQQWLESQEGKLRSGLSEQGMHLERFYVHRDGQQQAREQQRQQPQASAQRYRQQHNQSAASFEVVV